MKVKIYTFLILFALAATSFAQQKVNVRELVRKEFQSAKGIQTGYESENTSSSSIYIKLLILFAGASGSFGWVYLRRRKLNGKTNVEKLKENIKTLRDEKLKYEMDPRLKVIRKKLLDTVPATEIRSEAISSSARRLNISKEEISIAARLNYYAQKNVGGSIA